MILENVPVSLRGKLSRWMLEPKAGVFVGTISAMVREKLWEKVCDRSKEGGCTLIYSTNNEQGFAIRSYGNCTREVIDIEGLFLIRMAKNQ
ncbi:MAG: type I-E CRISPR-associated endoribonuclease Cas2e [bacterium]